MNEAEERDVAVLLSRGIVTEAQVEEARGIGRQMVEMGLRPRSVPEILSEKGYVDQEDLENVRKEHHTFEGRDQIAGYRLLELLGHGASGTVYRAKQVSLDREVAIKLLDPDLAQDADYVQRFLTEARKVARISHTNLISGIDVGQDGGIPYLVMEYADGVPVAFLLRRGGAMDEERALVVALQVARALDHVHKSGLVHRNVRPENVIVTRDGVAKLCDLGTGGLEPAGDAEEAAHAVSPDHLSPEQARGVQQLTPASDVYSLGAMLFHMVIGEPPFPAPSREAVLAKHLTEAPPSARQRLPELSGATDDLIRQCLAKSPEERPADAGQLAHALERHLRQLQAQRRHAAPAPAPQAPARSSAPAAPAAGEAPVARRRRRR